MQLAEQPATGWGPLLSLAQGSPPSMAVFIPHEPEPGPSAQAETPEAGPHVLLAQAFTVIHKHGFSAAATLIRPLR